MAKKIKNRNQFRFWQKLDANFISNYLTF
jgi:hypothetical protein